MAYSLSPIYSRFKLEVVELNRIINTLENKPVSLERDTHIEGCFIRFVVSWEVFSEEYFLRCLCGGRNRSKYEIKPQVTSFRNLNDAFKKVNVNRRDREKDYLDWLDASTVKTRINDYFRANSRVQLLSESPDKLFEIQVIRNAVAHRSTNAMYRFEKFVKDQLGYLSTLDPTMADLLIMKRRRNSKCIFLVYSEYFLDLADRLTK